jgi:hypothetical protein
LFVMHVNIKACFFYSCLSLSVSVYNVILFHIHLLHIHSDWKIICLKRMLLGSWQKPWSQTCSRSFKIRYLLRQ